MSETLKLTKNAVEQWVVTDQQAGQRLDNYLVTRLKSVPKSHIYRLLRTGQVRVNGRRVKPDYRLQEHDVVRVPPVRRDAPETPKTPSKGLVAVIAEAIIYDTPALLIINKPSGVAVHGGSGLSFGVIELLRTLYPNAPLLELVHRLDRDTSGCLMIARKRSMLRYLHDLLRNEHDIEKTYIALVAGRWPERKREVSAALRKNTLRSGERVVRVDDEGRESRTEFRVLEKFAGATLVQATPKTGRTHQIRVHAAHAGHPIIGDEKYGVDTVNAEFRQVGVKRLFLHAASLRFADPTTGKEIKVEAPIPPDLDDSLQSLRRRKV